MILAGRAELPARVEMDLDIGPLEIQPIIELLKLPVPLSGRMRIVTTAEGLLPTPVLRFSLTTEGLSIAGVSQPPGELALDLAIRGPQLLIRGKALGEAIQTSGTMSLLPPHELELDLEMHQARLSPLLGLVSDKLAEYIDGSLEGRFPPDRACRASASAAHGRGLEPAPRSG